MCDLCKAEKLTNWYEDNAVFWCADCKICLLPMIVFREHEEPTPEQYIYMIQWAKERFPELYIDMRRKRIKDHFHFHMRKVQESDAIQPVSYDYCDKCDNLIPLHYLTECRICGEVFCPSCQSNDIGTMVCIHCSNYQDVIYMDDDIYGQF